MNTAFPQLPPHEEDTRDALSKLATVSARDVFGALFRHKFKIMAIWLLGLVVAVIAVVAAEDYYESEAKLLVKFVRERVRLDPTSKLDSILAAHSWAGIINSEVELIRSRELAEIVAKEMLTGDDPDTEAIMAAAGKNHRSGMRGRVRGILGRIPVVNLLVPTPLDDIRRDPDAAVINISHNLKVEVPRNESIISLTYGSQSPEHSQRVLARLVDLYMEKHLAIHRVDGAYEFFLGQKMELEEQIHKTQEMMRNLKNDFKIGSVEAGARIVAERAGYLEMEKKRKESELAASDARLRILETTLVNLQSQLAEFRRKPEGDGIDEDALRHLSPVVTTRSYERLIDLQMREQELLTSYTNESLPVQKIRQQIDRMKLLLNQSLAQEGTLQQNSAGDAYSKMFLALLEEQQKQSSLQAELEMLETQLEHSKHDVVMINESEILLTRLQREMDLARASHLKYADMAEQARIDQANEAGQIANINVVQAATMPLMKVQSKNTRIAVTALVLALFGGVGVAFLFEYVLDHNVCRPEEIEKKLHLRPLASIPLMTQRLWRSRLTGAPVPQKTTDGTVVGWEVDEEFRNHIDGVCTQMLSQPVDRLPRPIIICVTACSRNRGVTTLASNLAVALAEHNGNVLLVDANIRNRKAHRFFGGAQAGQAEEKEIPGVGLASALQKNLLFVAAHESNGNGNGGKSRRKAIVPRNHCESIVRNLQAQNDLSFVVVDLPPITESAAALQFAASTQNVVLVAEAEKDKREVLQHAKRLCDGVGANIVGVILNKRRFYIPQWLYQRI